MIDIRTDDAFQTGASVFTKVFKGSFATSLKEAKSQGNQTRM